MKIYVKLTSVGKRRPVLENTPYELPEGILTMRELIAAIVCSEVEKFNDRGTDHMLVSFLTETEIMDQSISGKVGFGRLYSDRKADAEKAVETALIGYEDGLYRVLIGEKEVSGLDTAVALCEGDVLTFIRLTFLAGRLW